MKKKQPVPLLDEVLARHGWTPTAGDDWDLFWSGDAVESDPTAPGPRFTNHFREVVLVDHKASLGRLLTAARRRSQRLGDAAGWDFFPTTYDLPAERDAFIRDAHAAPGTVWIAKPSAGTHGAGQFLFTDPAAAPTEENWVVQHYLAEPHLLDGRKYTLRLYVLVTSLSPLAAAIYTDGLVKRSTVPYRAGPADLANRAMHLTNSDVQRETPAGDPPAMLLTEYRARLKASGGDFEALWSAVRRACARTLLASRDALLPANPPDEPSPLRRFDLLGVDFLVDRDHRPWLLEVNTNPSLRVETPPHVAGHHAERQFKLALLENTLRLAGPLASSSASPTSALESAGGFERLFPSAEAAGWRHDWFPHESDAAHFARLALPAPAYPAPRLPDDVVFTNEGLIAFAPGSTQLVAFNESATAIAVLSDEGCSRAEICTALTGHLATPPSRENVLHQIDEVLRALWNLTTPEFTLHTVARPAPPDTTPATGKSACYVLGDVRFRVHYGESDWAALAAAPLAPLAGADDGSPMHALAVRQNDERLEIVSQIRKFFVPDPPALPALLHSAMLQIVCQLPDTRVAFHAAAVARDSRGLILAGPSGAGKSTLAAALAQSGFDYLGDEAAILDTEFRLRAAPIALGLRPDALSLLTPFLPAAEELVVRRRRDGTSVHFLPPQNPTLTRREVAAVVFPRIAPGEPARLAPLGPTTALARLGSSGLALPRPLDPASGRALVHWLQHTPRFELVFSALPEAVALLRNYCETTSATVVGKPPKSLARH